MDHRLEQRMARSNEHRRSVGPGPLLVERDSQIFPLRLSEAALQLCRDLPDTDRHMLDAPATVLPRFHPAAQGLEGINEELLDVFRHQPLLSGSPVFL